MLIVYIAVSVHLFFGGIAYILERDRLKNTLLIKSEHKEYNLKNFNEEDNSGDRRCFYKPFRISKVKHGFCVSRNKYTNLTLLRNTVYSIFGGLYYLLNVLGKVSSALSIQSTVITDDYNDAVVLFGEKIMGGIDGFGELSYEVIYLPRVDYITVYTKSSLVYKIRDCWKSLMKLGDKYNRVMGIVKEYMNTQRK